MFKCDYNRLYTCMMKISPTSHLLVNLYNFNPYSVETSGIIQLKTKFKKVEILNYKENICTWQGFLVFHWSKLTIITMATTNTIMMKIVPNPTLKCRKKYFEVIEIRWLEKKSIYGQ